MNKHYDAKLRRAISIADFILENEGHTILEATKEFRLSRTTIERELQYLYYVAFHCKEPNEKELQQKYKLVKATLARLTKEHKANNIAKYNAQKATSN